MAGVLLWLRGSQRVSRVNEKAIRIVKWSRYCSGVLLEEEALKFNFKDGRTLPEMLSQRGVLSAMRADQGFVPRGALDSWKPHPHGLLRTTLRLNSFGEKGTEGMATASRNRRGAVSEVLLEERCEDFYQSGVRLAKWRTQVECNLELPTDVSVWENTDCLARAARICQAHYVSFEVVTITSTVIIICIYMYPSIYIL